MSIITRKRLDDCTVVPIDDRLSFEAHGVLAYVLANRRDDGVRTKDIQVSGSIGRDKTLRLVRKLIDIGYLSRTESGSILVRDEVFPPTINPGFVYVLAAVNGGVKVGASTDPVRRLKQINAGKLIDAEIVYQAHFNDYFDAERRAHALLRKWCLSNEWFSCPQDVAVEAVKSLEDGLQ
ncbi:MAG: GIY-YIG nuclease family protein [Mesorhizobium sp.]